MDQRVVISGKVKSWGFSRPESVFLLVKPSFLPERCCCPPSWGSWRTGRSGGAPWWRWSRGRRGASPSWSGRRCWCRGGPGRGTGTPPAGRISGKGSSTVTIRFCESQILLAVTVLTNDYCINSTFTCSDIMTILQFPTYTLWPYPIFTVALQRSAISFSQVLGSENIAFGLMGT